MAPDKMSDPSPLPTVQAVMIGTGTGDGGATRQLVQTPAGQPNVVLRYITPLMAISIRFANAYVTALLGLVTVGLTTDALPAADFASLVVRCAGLAVAGPAVSLGKDLITILGGLEKRFPLSTGSV